MSNDHKNYKRPEITRSFETLAKDQRETINEQKKKNEMREKMKNLDFLGLINSKIYSYVELSTDSCVKNCNKYKQDKIDEKHNLDTSVFRFNLKSASKNDFMKENINLNCMENCLNKKIESYRMSLNYFFAKMKYDENKKDDVHSLYEIPDKFKNNNFKN